MNDDFLWGVATAAYQVEGGLNTPGAPANNWAPWDRSGKVERCGEAVRFWDRPDELLDRTAGLGCNAFRMSVEWARVQPGPDAWDGAVLDRYAEILSRARAAGLEPVVTLHHFTHPLWCGRDPWLDRDFPRRFAAFAGRCVSELADRGARVRWWVTINEPAILALSTYFLRAFPGTGWGVRRTATALDHLLAGHVEAYDAIHDSYETRGLEAPMVSTNAFSMTTVALDALTVDLLMARERGVERHELSDGLRSWRSRARRRVSAVRRRDLMAVVIDRALHSLTRFGSVGASSETAAALYRSPRPGKLDYLSIDVYDPVAGHQFGPAPAGARPLRAQPGVAELWEQRFDPASMAVFLRQAHLQAPDRPVLVAENGMCTPGDRPRPDGLTRDVYLRAMCAEVLRARREGVPVAGYLHWSLVDNYEWGSYRPRFGLYGVDRTAGSPRILDTDAVGVDAAGAYRDIIRTASAPGPGRAADAGAAG